MKSRRTVQWLLVLAAVAVVLTGASSAMAKERVVELLLPNCE